VSELASSQINTAASAKAADERQRGARQSELARSQINTAATRTRLTSVCEEVA